MHLILALLLWPGAARAAELTLTVTPLAGDVYALVGRQGDANSGFIVTSEGVVVVDSQMTGELASVALEMIRSVTSRPLLYLINTHSHGDHTFANHRYLGVKAIIAHEEARAELGINGEAMLERFKRFFGESRGRDIRVTLPTQTVTERMTLPVPGRQIEIMPIGRGHTAGDLVVWLPKERVLFAGDLVYVDRLPWLADGDTLDWLKALSRLKALDPLIVVPGHGAVGNKASIARMENYLTDLRAEVMRLRLRGAPLQSAIEAIQLPRYQTWLKYTEWLPRNVEKVYAELESGD